MNKYDLCAVFQHARANRLNSIYLDNQQIETLPPQIRVCNYKGLYVLDLSGNKLQKLPEELFELESLKYLDLSNNQLKQIPVSIYKLKRLEYLRLDGNCLSQIPIELCRCKHLKTLHLERNQLKKIPIQFLKHPNYKQLNLEYDDTYLDKKSVFRAENLKRALQFLERNPLQRKQVGYIPLNGISSLLPPLIQYCSFFETYVKNAKGVDLDIRLVKSANGLKLETDQHTNYSIIQIRKHLREFLSFISAREISVMDKIENITLKRDIELLEIQIRMHVSNFERQLDILQGGQ